MPWLEGFARPPNGHVVSKGTPARVGGQSAEVKVRSGQPGAQLEVTEPRPRFTSGVAMCIPVGSSARTVDVFFFPFRFFKNTLKPFLLYILAISSLVTAAALSSCLGTGDSSLPLPCQAWSSGKSGLGVQA